MELSISGKTWIKKLESLFQKITWYGHWSNSGFLFSLKETQIFAHWKHICTISSFSGLR